MNPGSDRARRAFAVLAALAVGALVACGSPVATVPPTGTATVSTGTPTPSPTSPAPTTASPASPSAPTTTTPSPTAAPLPVAQDVSAWEKSDFASPTGRIWCGLSASGALCHFPRGFQGTIPKGADVCPEEGLDVTGVYVDAAGTGYFCSGDPSAYPVKGSNEVRWHLTTGYGFVEYDGLTLAVLPYGKALGYGRYVCASASTGVTCRNTSIGRGFSIALAGVAFS